jgi:hypothetical protein
MSLLAALPLGFAVAGLVLGRWRVVAAAAAAWAGIAGYLVANDGWHGNGWGEFGVRLNVLVALATVAGAALGVALHRLVDYARGRHGRLA